MLGVHFVNCFCKFPEYCEPFPTSVQLCSLHRIAGWACRNNFIFNQCLSLGIGLLPVLSVAKMSMVHILNISLTMYFVQLFL